MQVNFNPVNSNNYIKSTDANNLLNGKQITAEVVKNDNGNVAIRLPSGQVIEAALDQNVQVKLGDILNLQVKDNTNSANKIELKILGKETEGNNNFLKASDIKTNEILTALNANGMEATEENIENIKNLNSVFKDVSVKDIVFLISKGLEVNEENLNILKEVNDNKISLGNNLKKVEENLIKLLDEGTDSNKKLEKIINKYSNMFKNEENGDNNIIETTKDKITKIINSIVVSSDELTGDKIKNINGDVQKFLDMLKEVDNNFAKSNIGEGIKENISALTKSIESNVKFLDQVNQNYFQCFVPINNNGENNTAQLIIKDKNLNNKLKKGEAISVFFSLDTNNMDIVKISMNYINKTLSLDFKVKDKDVLIAFNQKKEELIKVLKENSLNIANLNFNIDNSADKEEMMDNNQGFNNLKGHFDFRV